MQLPNGWSVPAQSQVEALFIYREIVEQLCYLQNGIYIKDQDVIMDVGANIGQSCCIITEPTVAMMQRQPLLAVQCAALLATQLCGL